MPDWGPWAILSGLLASVMLSDLIGARSTILSSKKFLYFIYFLFRFLAEAFKVFIIYSLWRDAEFFFTVVTFNSHVNAYYEFMFTLSACLFLTLIIFFWSIVRMYKCYSERARNMSQQIKAKWRVEQKDFNRNFSVNSDGPQDQQ